MNLPPPEALQCVYRILQESNDPDAAMAISMIDAMALALHLLAAATRLIDKAEAEVEVAH